MVHVLGNSCLKTGPTIAVSLSKEEKDKDFDPVLKWFHSRHSSRPRDRAFNKVIKADSVFVKKHEQLFCLPLLKEELVTAATELETENTLSW